MRVCARSDCSAPAAAILTYDRVAQTAYLFAVDDPTTRSPGDLCDRHLRRLVLPRSWCLDDRREPTVPTGTVLTRTPRSTSRAARTNAGRKWAEVGPSLFDAETGDGATPEVAAVAAITPITAVERDERPASTEPAWMPHFGPETELDEVLDANTPLLRRAFGGS
jgi:hypothetical protein